jgi:DNA polymerase III subunit gamma/tau
MPDEVHSLYRRYRSRTFGELIGQDHVSRTLLNTLAAGRIAHAYLFAGPRGSGKTSTARILAKAVNCLNNGGKGEPCNQCEMCVAINEGRALDLIEIDAASNRGIDEIRDLRDKVHFSPTQARYKVYILDEAHMLTNEAFNALLKTLEEPPAHAIFALVTTEAHKIPPTILSRCQRFDFHRASMRDILEKLNHICQEEHIKVEPAALTVIARAATGSYRDAESLLDQLASFTGDQGITLSYLQQVLGLAPLDATSKLVAHMARRDASAGLQLLTEIMQGGADLRQFTRDLVDYLRNLMLVKTGNDALLDTTPELVDEMKAQVKLLTVTELVRLIKLFSDPDIAGGLRGSAQPQLPLELAFLDACNTEGQPAPAQAERSSGPVAPPVAAPRPTSAPDASAQEPAHTPAPPTTHPAPAPAHSAPPPTHVAPPPAARPSTAYTPPARTAAPAPARSAPPPASAAPAHPASPPRPAAPMAITAPAGSPLAIVQEHWQALLEAVKNGSRSVEAFLKECHPIEADEEAVVLGFKYPFHKDSVDNPKNRALVEEAFSKVLARPIRVRCTLMPKDGPASSGGVTVKDQPQSPAEDPNVKLAEQLFGGKVVHVERTNQ